MDDILLLEAIERYLSGDMNAAERSYFENLRKNTPEIDQMVVEHSMFLHQMDIYSVHRNLRNSLQTAHSRLLETGEINESGELTTKGKVIQLWKKYKRVTAIAATVGGFIALVISGLTLYFSPVRNGQIEELSREVATIRTYQKVQNGLIREVDNKIPKGGTVVSGGTGFLVDTKGYLITNAHVLKGSGVVVVNSGGQEYNAKVVGIDNNADLAILKIADNEFEPLKSLPYTIRKSGADMGEKIFTLGYPRNDIVYGEGYLSARTGFNGDSMSYQIQISANPGNSGGPVFNNNGDVIGILSTRQAEAEGVAFAVKSKNIYRMISNLDDSIASRIKMGNTHHGSALRGMERKEQIGMVEDCVYYVKSFKN
ncbi:S1C family serine protease [Sediminibacterium soli]|uniref:S1C family serine protease n=1 Tax=Sediminibacterium soli TaxID=2698829 RepID=UPI00192A1C24|nr:serine protease [Sediminibacterium soli]